MTFADNFNEHLPAMLEALGGDVATFTPKNAGSYEAIGLFESDYFAYPGQTVEVSSAQPRFTCQSKDVAGIAYGDALSVRGAAYKIVEIRPDGQGVTTLILELQP